MTERTVQQPAGERWGRIPAWWLDHPDLDADGLAVLAALSTYADEAGVCWPAQATLATKLKRSRPTVNRILGRLEAVGLVAIEHRSSANGGRLSCRYRLRLSPIAAPDSRTDSPCPAPSQEQPQPEQIPDPLGERGRQAAGASPEATTPSDSASEVPADWTPTNDDRTWAVARFPHADLDHHAELFVRRCQAHGYRYRDVGAAWRSWLLQDLASPSRPRSGKPTDAPGAASRRTTAEDAERRLSAWANVAATLNGRSAPIAAAASPWIVA